jgi:acyl-CoA synthetase (AMP-forming)/AMP-acid ligase II
MTVSTLSELLQSRVQSHGERRAYTFLADGELEHASLSYAELDARARSIAAYLRERAAPGDRVALAYPPGLEVVTALFACAYAGAIAVPVPVPRPRRGSERLDGVVKSCEPRLVMSTEAGLTALAAAAAVPSTIDAIDSESIADAGLGVTPVNVRPDDLALLQYTSGSTTAPRGVKVSHGNLIANLAMIHAAEANDATSRGVSWLPAFHDMGLVEGVLEPLYGGYPTWLMPPSAFLQRPVRWLQALSDYGGTVSGAPDFAYDLCVRRLSDEEIETLDLSAWRVAYSGAEPVRDHTLRAFASRFGRCGFERRAFRPVYGLAEATALVSASVRAHCEPRVDTVDGRDLVSCGVTHAGTRVAIVDPATGREVEDGETGEICVTGPSVAHGYWGASDEESRVFSRAADGARSLRSGDLGYVRGGELYIAGRLKDMIVLRGRKLYPQDIEHTVQASHALVCPGGVAAFGVHADGAEALVVVAEVEESPRVLLAPALDAIAQAVLRDHDCAIAATILVKRGVLPRTSSGKLMRFRCRNDYLAGALQALARADAIADGERRVA